MTTKNEVLLEGLVLAEPEWSHENHGTQFYRVTLQVPRLSGQVDVLPLLAPGALAAQTAPGRLLRVRGQLRSFNNRSGVGSRLVLTVYAQEFQPGLDEACNQITLAGALCKPPVFRRTPLGRSICDLMLAVPRRYGRADYLPVIAWGQLAVKASRLQVGDPLALEGRVQSRTYYKNLDSGETEERVAYEVSVMRLLDGAELEETETAAAVKGPSA
ncbi:single-stranded DNA-binding protein [uncultured Oscillibacter sp.]|uniref:single-stranded DNA-binding protein n=1 Tax=uncultured Oscillibacter sp. TaxID=876091 RepID=UPI00262484C1|nr:single-stranded DNA-binding protein [uncultured Oscillibacter sp.]